jgi:phage protein D
MTVFTPVYRLPLTEGADPQTGPFENFYVPRFVVKTAPAGQAAQELPPEIINDVIQVTYRDNLEDIDSFDLLISNYENDFSQPLNGLRAKYEPPSRPEFDGIFDPGKRLELWMGYGDKVILMLTGQITTLEPNFPAGGGMTLSVRGLNELHRFRAAQHTYVWNGKRDSEIAEEIGSRPQELEKPGINFKVKTDETAKALEKPDEHVFMYNKFDILFLMERARRRDYELVLRETDSEGRPDPHLYFGPSNNRDMPAYLLEWGRSLVSFRPTLTTANQVSEVLVAGWDRRLNKRIEGKATWADILENASDAEKERQQRLAQAFGNRREVITDVNVFTEEDAKSKAKDILRELAKEMVEANGETVGLPDLRAGRKVRIENLGERFSGVYYITESVHTIGGSGYKTTFKARREEALNR